MNKNQHYPDPYSQNNYHSPYPDPSEYEGINQQLQLLDRQNRKLVSIAENIMKTSFIRQAEQTPAVILQLEEDMKMSFNALIQSIRQFFMSIDGKLKQLGLAIEKKMGDCQLDRSRLSSRAENEKLDMLTRRMASMEENIRKSQDNEAKLISIIEDMNTKRYFNQQQPTIRKDPDTTPQMPFRKPGSQHENSFRLFSMGFSSQNNSSQEPRLDYQPTYKKFQQYSNYPIVESTGPFNQRHQLQDRPQYFCGIPPRIDNQKSDKKVNYLKSSAHDFEIQSSNRIHRLSNLLKGLKE